MGTVTSTTRARVEKTAQRRTRAQAIAAAGGLEQVVGSGALPRRIDTTLSEAIVLGLLRQGVHTFLCVHGHGSTEIGEVLRVYGDAGLVRVCAVRSEIEASHAASALRWVTGEKAAVVTSIGPGALHALAASIVPASDGIGVWYLLGDETTEDEGPNMQQVPGSRQHAFLGWCSTMWRVLHPYTPGPTHGPASGPEHRRSPEPGGALLPPAPDEYPAGPAPGLQPQRAPH